MVAGGVYAVVMVGVAAYRARAPYVEGVGTSDFVAFWVTARQFLETGQVTPDAGVRNYLPFFTLLMVPFAALPCWLAAAIMTMMSIAGLALSVAMMLRGLVPENHAPPIAAAGVPVLMALPFIHACLVLGQVSILMLLLCILTWWLVAVRRPWSAGVSLAIAVLVKPFLITLLAFLVLKRQWRAAGATVAWLGLFGAALTLAVMGPHAWLDAHRSYYQRVIKNETPLALIASEKPRTARFSNQSLPIVLRRLSTDTPAGRAKEPFQVNVAACSARVPQALYLVIILGVGLTTIIVGRHPPDRIEPRRAHLEFATFLLWGLLGSPIVWTHYYPLVLYPLVLLAVRLQCDRHEKRSNRLGAFVWWFWIAAACSLITEALTLPYLRAVGVHLWATMLLWLAMIAFALRVRPLAANASTATIIQ